MDTPSAYSKSSKGTTTFSTPPPQNQGTQAALPSSSPISQVDSIFTPGSSTSTRRLSISTSISATSFHSCASEKPKIDVKDTRIKTRCLQCKILGLRCSLPREPIWKEQVRPTNFCRRCEKDGERFCILQEDDTSEYFSNGAQEYEVNERVDQLLAPKREAWKWCLPKIPPGTRAVLRKVWSRLPDD